MELPKTPPPGRSRSSSCAKRSGAGSSAGSPDPSSTNVSCVRRARADRSDQALRSRISW
jgi:hypothetical protein